MISPERNRRLWQACGWKVLNDKGPKYLHLWSDPDGDAVTLPSPSDPVSFTGHLLRDGLSKVREKYKDSFEELAIYRMLFNGVEQEVAAIRTNKDSMSAHADTLSEAMFLAFEQALLGPQDSQQAG